MRRMIFLSLVCLGLAGTRVLTGTGFAETGLPTVDAAPIAFGEDAALAHPVDTLRRFRSPAAPPSVSTPEPSAIVARDAAESTDPDVIATLDHLRSRHTGLSRAELPALAELIVSEARKHKMSPGLALAVIRVESGCFNYAVSSVGAMGLMQLMPATGEELANRLGLDWAGPDSLFDPRINVKLGLTYLKQLTERYGSTDTALAAYNWGPGRIDRRLRRGQDVPTLYATQVMKRRDRT